MSQLNLKYILISDGSKNVTEKTFKQTNNCVLFIRLFPSIFGWIFWIRKKNLNVMCGLHETIGSNKWNHETFDFIMASIRPGLKIETLMDLNSDRVTNTLIKLSHNCWPQTTNALIFFESFSWSVVIEQLNENYLIAFFFCHASNHFIWFFNLINWNYTI